jgi:hypothetical protein
VKNLFGYALTYAKSAEAALVENAIIILYNPVQEYMDAMAHVSKGSIVIDCWRALSKDALPDGVTYVPMGDGPQL